MRGALKKEGLFWIALVDRPRVLHLLTVLCGPSLVDRPLWTVPCGLAMRGALKTRGCYGLHSWTAPRIGLMDHPLWTVPHRSTTHGALKPGVVPDCTQYGPSSRIGLMDCPSWTVPSGLSLVDRPSWTVPRGPSLVDRPSWTGPCGSVTCGARKTGRCSKSGRNILFSFLDTVLLSAHIERVSVSICKIFVILLFIYLFIFFFFFGGGGG